MISVTLTAVSPKKVLAAIKLGFIFPQLHFSRLQPIFSPP